MSSACLFLELIFPISEGGLNWSALSGVKFGQFENCLLIHNFLITVYAYLWHFLPAHYNNG